VVRDRRGSCCLVDGGVVMVAPDKLTRGMVIDEELKAEIELRYNGWDELRQQLDTAWAQAHRLALELECLLLDTKDNAVVSKWWDSGMEALSEYQELKPGAKEEAEAWGSIRKEPI